MKLFEQLNYSEQMQYKSHLRKLALSCCRGQKGKQYWMHFATALLGVLILFAASIALPQPTTYALTGDWSTFLENNARTGFNGAETIINPSTAPNLKLQWEIKATGTISAQIVEANGMIYWGAWGGDEHASRLSDGSVIWTAPLGRTTDPDCNPPEAGVASTATVATVSINGTMTPVVFVGGGEGSFYALNASTGAIIWQTVLGSKPSHFLWSSPALYNGSIYEGVSSYGDCPLVQGQLVQMNASTGAIEHTFNVVPTGCIGGSVWGSPAIDTTTGMIYFGTGNPGSCSTSETMAPALIALKADLSFVGSWQVPQSKQIQDSDFGSTPTLFNATIGGTSHQMVGLVNKNGIYYAFDRTAISAGPLWQMRLAVKGGFSSSAWDGTTLYAASSSTTIKGTHCGGSLRALNPANGAFLWQDCLKADVLDPVTAVPGLAEVGAGASFEIVNTTTGMVLFSFHDTTKGASFWGPASISNGVLYQGDSHGNLYAFGP